MKLHRLSPLFWLAVLAFWLAYHRYGAISPKGHSWVSIGWRLTGHPIDAPGFGDDAAMARRWDAKALARV